MIFSGLAFRIFRCAVLFSLLLSAGLRAEQVPWVPLTDESRIFSKEQADQIMALAVQIRDETGVHVEVKTLSFGGEAAMGEWGTQTLGTPRALLVADRSSDIIAYRVNDDFYNLMSKPVHEFRQEKWGTIQNDSSTSRDQRILQIMEVLRQEYGRRAPDERGGFGGAMLWPILIGLVCSLPLFWFFLRGEGASRDEQRGIAAAERQRASGVRMFPDVPPPPSRFGGKYSGGTSVEQWIDRS